MPTISEPVWREIQERVKIAVQQFIEATPQQINDSEDVLKARLFGYGLRGSDLDVEVWHAKDQKFQRQKCPGTGKVCPRIRLYGKCECAWKDRINAA